MLGLLEPSYCHNSWPLAPSLALKYNLLLNTAKPDGDEPPEPLTISKAMLGLLEPSYCHNSLPLIPSSAAKYNLLLNTVKFDIDELPGPLLISNTIEGDISA